MKRTLKRGLKAFEIVNRESNRTEISYVVIISNQWMPTLFVSELKYTSGWRRVFIGLCTMIIYVSASIY